MPSGASGEPASLADLARDPADRDRALPALPLMLVRRGEAIDAPAAATELRPGDELLYAGTGWARRAMAETLLNVNTADYVLTGRAPASLLGRLLDRGSRPASSRSQKLSALAWRICGSRSISASAEGAIASSTPSSAIASPLFSARPRAKVAMLTPRSPSLVPSAPM